MGATPRPLVLLLFVLFVGGTTAVRVRDADGEEDQTDANDIEPRRTSLSGRPSRNGVWLECPVMAARNARRNIRQSSIIMMESLPLSGARPGTF